MSPISSWDGATAIFTGADSGISIGIFLIASVVLCVVPIIECAMHESKLYKKVANGEK